MIIPFISLILGSGLAFLTLLSYRGTSTLKSVPFLADVKQNKPIALGGILLSTALMLGMLGYFNIIEAPTLKTIRLFSGVSGLVLLLTEYFKLKKSENMQGFLKIILRWGVIRIALTLLSIVILGSIFGIAFFDANYGGDAFMYQIPFAARLWGIIPKDVYEFEYFMESRYLGFPLLANFIQGFFWFIFQRPEATNLLCYSSLIVLIVFLCRYLKIPFYLTTVSLLAIPMVHMHAARSYIDLPGNVAMTVLIIINYLFYTHKIQFNFTNGIIIFLAAFTAANMKHQLVPLVFIALCFVVLYLLIKTWKTPFSQKTKIRQSFAIIACSSLISLLVFATSVRNIIVYQNPFYPIKVSIAGHVLNYIEAPPEFMHESLRKLPPHLRWAKSILEIDAFDKRRPWPWTLAMDFIPWTEARFGLGGYFGGYVVLNLILFAYFCWQQWGLETKNAGIVMLILTAITPLMPQAYELRYFMYWIIVLVAFNLYFLTHLMRSSYRISQFINAPNWGLIATAFMYVFITKTNTYFTRPEFYSFERQVFESGNVKPEIFRQIKDGDRVCLVGKAPNSFLYSSYFHPNSDYFLKAEFEIDDQFTKDKCGDLKIIK